MAKTRRSAGAEPARSPRLRRGRLIRDAVMFQIKLLIDGARDVLLVPVSLVAAGLDFLTGGHLFYDLLRMGKRSDRWIDLFGAARRDDAGGAIDEAVGRLESLVLDQYRSGELSATARSHLDGALKRLGRRLGNQPRRPDPE